LDFFQTNEIQQQQLVTKFIFQINFANIEAVVKHSYAFNEQATQLPSGSIVTTTMTTIGALTSMPTIGVPIATRTIPFVQ